jgi:predicted enzyme related to lactoylglutathione lyase
MSQKTNNSVFYVEFPAIDLGATKQFYQKAFGWTFEDYGPAYIAFEDGQLAGGFYQAEGPAPHGLLVVLWGDDLKASQLAVEQAGGVITKPIFDYPGGRRFHFTDPNGNELSVCGEA